MNTQEIEQFKKDYKKILWQNELLNKNKKVLHNLHLWDKNDSHKSSIIHHVKERDVLLRDLQVMLKGKSYEDWKLTSKKLTNLTAKLTKVVSQKSKYELEIDNLAF